MNYEKLVQTIDPEILRHDAPLREYTSFRVGGACDYMVSPRTVEELSTALQICREEDFPYYVLGNGTNVIALDEGYRGVVIRIGEAFSNIQCDESDIVAGAGALLSAVAREACTQSLTGMEFAEGIPGSVGGGVVMNAGAYDGELSQVITSVLSMSPSGESRRWTPEDCQFGHRTSVFQTNGHIVLEAHFSLQEGDASRIRKRMEELMQRRNTRQPLQSNSAGSTFKRPERTPEGKQYYAGTLIQESGLKGLQVGGARVSEKHAGFIVNAGTATAEDILTLMELVRNTVYDQYHILLEPEVRILK